MFVIEDKTPYGVLRAVVAQLEKDAADAKHRRDRETSQRSKMYHQKNAEMGAYNSAIAFITSTDVWRNRPKPEKPKHVHVRMGEQDRQTFTNPVEATSWLRAQGYPADDMFALLQVGIIVSLCDRVDCLAVVVPPEQILRYGQTDLCVCEHTCASHGVGALKKRRYCEIARCACQDFRVMPENVKHPGVEQQAV